MQWLITLKRSVKPTELRQLLDASGCVVESEDSIPLGDDEQVIQVSGPRDLPERLRPDRRVLMVSPNSELTLY